MLTSVPGTATFGLSRFFKLRVCSVRRCPICRKQLMLLGFVFLIALVPICIGREKRNTYAGLTAARWEAEIAGRMGIFGEWTPEGRRSTLWIRGPTSLERWLEWAGLRSDRYRYEHPLLHGDPAAIPVLMELLTSRDNDVRLVALEGLSKLGPQARCAVPALLDLLHDREEDVRQQAEETIFFVDRETAEKAGVKWQMWREIQIDETPLAAAP